MSHRVLRPRAWRSGLGAAQKPHHPVAHFLFPDAFPHLAPRIESDKIARTCAAGDGRNSEPGTLV